MVADAQQEECQTSKPLTCYAFSACSARRQRPPTSRVAREALGYERLAADTGSRPVRARFRTGAHGLQARVGIAVSPAFTRTPAVFASMSGSIAQLMPGRFVLGLGASSETIVDRWNGVPFEKPLKRVRETVTLVRAMLQGERTSFKGETVRSEGFRLTALPPQPVPLYVGALKPPMLRLAGEIGDGVAVNLFPASALPRMIAEVERGAAKAEKRASDLEIVCRFQTWVTDDPKGARALLRRAMAGYFTTSVYNAFAEWCGFADEAARDARSLGEARPRAHRSRLHRRDGRCDHASSAASATAGIASRSSSRRDSPRR
jgi:alkanesulfonate monooxygenase SsuD/methylene tetrahydromethanopterin reductase-like flavin-dependent oxidoreductase (luciferase family)